MLEQSLASKLANVPDDVILDEGVRRLKKILLRKTGKEASPNTCFEIVTSYGEIYSVEVYKRSDFYRSQPNLKLIEGLD
jgi:hypothetical protein